MTAEEFEARIVAWARRQPDVKALIQIGSRAQAGRNFDKWSDWDFHLVSTSPQKYYGTSWLAEIAPPWCVNAERSSRGNMKVSVVFEEGLEADFVLLASWQMKLLYWGMKHPELAKWMPKRLHQGILEMRVILMNSGYRVLLGGASWEKRMAALDVQWGSRRMNEEEFNRHTSAYWQKAVWVAKKIARPELRSAMHWLHKLVLQHTYALLEEEAWLAGKGARPEALKAEKWLDAKRLAQTEIETEFSQSSLASALLAELSLFEDVSANIAKVNGFALPDYSAVAAWLRAELNPLVEKH